MPVLKPVANNVLLFACTSCSPVLYWYQQEATTDWRTLNIIAYHWRLVFKNYRFLPEDGALVPKHVGDTRLISKYN